MTGNAETEERNHLETIKARLRSAIDRIDALIDRYAQENKELRHYAWEHNASMDKYEKQWARKSVDLSAITGENALARKEQLHRLMLSPYFGRFDFLEQGGAEPLRVYLGIHGFADDADHRPLVYDWRAPISTMFYDFETGAARYAAPSGGVEGQITLKRQYRIRDGRMEFMIESAVSVMDTVLQEELSRTSDNRMRNIVATIQRDQNAIVRNENAHELIIQGVAGSGKTSLALHRIAYLLYRFRGSLTSNNILIISPNKVFADYISNVLPELGEEEISEIGLETLARHVLGDDIVFQDFFEQVSLLLEKGDPKLAARIREKSTLEFLGKLDDYVRHLEQARFRAADMTVNGHLVPAWFIEEGYAKHGDLPAAERLGKIAEDIEYNVFVYYTYEVTGADRRKIARALKGMFETKPLRATYKEFFAWLGKPGLFKPGSDGTLEYSDVFPLAYLKIRLEGTEKVYDNVKHLLVDEMQDYTPVQYAVIARLFPCRKTILGDMNQSVNPYGSSDAATIQKVFPGSERLQLCKSYRSTYEIIQFAQRISPNEHLVPVERHGEEPKLAGFASGEDEAAEIARLAAGFPGSGQQTLGIICKTGAQAEALHGGLRARGLDAHLLTSRTVAFHRGVTVCTAHLAKGLEFDHVIVPHASDDNYATPLDRSMLYVACTRAMHRLTLTFTGTPSPFVRQQSPQQ